MSRRRAGSGFQKMINYEVSVNESKKHTEIAVSVVKPQFTKRWKRC
ncbi:MAG: hypothetical protein L0387_36580 [Acidobacteria bacterium]|nr:hypothetical protein [Acidobacteriota bacterium]